MQTKTKVVTLNPGQSAVVDFTFNEQVIGQHDVAIDNLSSSFRVLNPTGVGTVRGTAFDSSNNPLPDVYVSVGSYFTFTDEDGRYAITEIPVGSYTVSFAKEGYMPYYRPVTVKAGATHIINGHLF